MFPIFDENKGRVIFAMKKANDTMKDSASAMFNRGHDEKIAGLQHGVFQEHGFFALIYAGVSSVFFF